MLQVWEGEIIENSYYTKQVAENAISATHKLFIKMNDHPPD